MRAGSWLEGLPLAAREKECLKLVSLGLTNREIAARMLIAPETVKTHVRHILVKLDARNRAHACALAVRSGLI